MPKRDHAPRPELDAENVTTETVYDFAGAPISLSEANERANAYIREVYTQHRETKIREDYLAALDEWKGRFFAGIDIGIELDEARVFAPVEDPQS